MYLSKTDLAAARKERDTVKKGLIADLQAAQGVIRSKNDLKRFDAAIDRIAKGVDETFLGITDAASILAKYETKT